MVSKTKSADKSTITVIMPVFNADHFLPLALPPLVEMKARGEIVEVLVVDDHSTDRSAACAEELGARVITSPDRAGPGRARNLGAKEAKGEILWFVDADVIAHADGAERIREAFEDAEAVAVFGSYDDAPPAKNFASQYKNLVHHYYHQLGKREASTFWAGCGAVRKAAFLEVGGFDIKRYKRPSIEDIELGYRLRAKGGRILLVHDLKGTHLKHWTVRDMVFTDVFCRALPWARLMLTQVGMTDDLNVSKTERMRAALAGLLVLSFAPALFLPGWAWLPPAFIAAVTAANWRLFDFMRGRKGLAFAFLALLFHQVYYLYSTAAFVWCWLEARLTGAGRPVAA